jgi:hypothetical protein
LPEYPGARRASSEDFMSSSLLRYAGAGCVAVMLAGCAVKRPEPPPVVKAAPPPPKVVTCAPPAVGSPLVGTWYSTSTPRDVSGRLESLYVLSDDGKMRYETQLQIGKRIRPALRESGCWTYADGIYTMQTMVSNGDPVDVTDPIYHNRYKVEKLTGNRLVMRDLKSGGQVITSTKMAPGYQLP